MLEVIKWSVFIHISRIVLLKVTSRKRWAGILRSTRRRIRCSHSHHSNKYWCPKPLQDKVSIGLAKKYFFHSKSLNKVSPIRMIWFNNFRGVFPLPKVVSGKLKKLDDNFIQLWKLDVRLWTRYVTLHFKFKFMEIDTCERGSDKVFLIEVFWFANSKIILTNYE